MILRHVGPMTIADLMVDVIFFIDIFVNFCTGYFVFDGAPLHHLALAAMHHTLRHSCANPHASLHMCGGSAATSSSPEPPGADTADMPGLRV